MSVDNVIIELTRDEIMVLTKHYATLLQPHAGEDFDRKRRDAEERFIELSDLLKGWRDRPRTRAENDLDNKVRRIIELEQ